MSTPSVRAGDLNRRIIIEQRASARDAFGQQVTTWTTFATPFAKIEPLSGRELQLAQAVNAETSHKVTIRYRPGITTAMRAVYQGRYFNILSAMDLETAHVVIEMMCSEGLVDG